MRIFEGANVLGLIQNYSFASHLTDRGAHDIVHTGAYFNDIDRGKSVSGTRAIKWSINWVCKLLFNL